MATSLIVVESPTKVRTIKKFLGSGFDVVASMGHIKDLPKSKLGIDLEKDFEPTYKTIEAKKKTIDELKKAAKKAENIYLACDPDREGEAIAWHISEVVDTKNKNIYRVLFNDLTKKTVLEAMEKPLELDFNKYEAQQTRRILDRLVGYQISPILWDKVKRGLSAGRVQSVAVRLICEREEEIGKFVPEEYWNLVAQFEGNNPPPFEAKLIKIDGKKAKVSTGDQANELADTLKKSSFVVESLEKKELKRSAPPPFTTSKLQQEASRWLRYSAKKTMMVAQKLYEGIELGDEGPVGLITYMRTDSFRVANEALKELRGYISDSYSSDYLPPQPLVYKNSQKAQDAHEAIRPSSMSYKPQDIKEYLSNDEFKLYQLIWNRFVASQMNPAVFDQTTIDVGGANCIFRAQGQILKFPGFTIVYTEGKDEKDENGENNDLGKLLPDIKQSEPLKLVDLKTQQKFTQPPPRFSEASLVRELEEKGIGRPSTYAAILSTIQDREYVRLEQRKFFPTELGIIVTELLVKSFPSVLDVAFTAGMENKLDMIEEGNSKRVETLSNFYDPFSNELEKAKSEMRNIKREETPTDLVCEKCGSPMIIKWGRNGKFVACSNYPECKNTMNIKRDKNGDLAREEAEYSEQICDKCGKRMVYKYGRFGKFLGCEAYPECKNTMAISLGIKCPQKDCPGSLTEKKTKRGRTFYGCSNYPNCTFASWDKPLPEACPNCGSPYLVEKYSKSKGAYKACPNKECGYKSAIENQ
ncbi:MAG TPA: type I DNA topoisomerase [Deltaproteobacteria bacterium]|nr:type I DNA topoisomerase [Deltaproteobacteria bacterium]